MTRFLENDNPTPQSSVILAHQQQQQPNARPSRSISPTSAASKTRPRALSPARVKGLFGGGKSARKGQLSTGPGKEIVRGNEAEEVQSGTGAVNTTPREDAVFLMRGKDTTRAKTSLSIDAAVARIRPSLDIPLSPVGSVCPSLPLQQPPSNNESNPQQSTDEDLPPLHIHTIPPASPPTRALEPVLSTGPVHAQPSRFFPRPLQPTPPGTTEDNPTSDIASQIHKLLYHSPSDESVDADDQPTTAHPFPSTDLFACLSQPEMMNGREGCACSEGKEEIKARPSVWEQLEKAATDSFGSIMVSCDLPQDGNEAPHLELAEYHDISEDDIYEDDSASTFSDHGSLHESSCNLSSPSSQPTTSDSSLSSPATATLAQNPHSVISGKPNLLPLTSWLPSWPFGGKGKANKTDEVPAAEIAKDGGDEQEKKSKKVVRVWYPSKTQISLHATWWGYSIYLPPPVMAVLSEGQVSTLKRVAAISSGLGFILKALPALVTLGPEMLVALTLLAGLVPILGYISSFIAFSWSNIQSYDKGKGVILSATWILPIALITRAWDVPSSPQSKITAPKALPDPAPPCVETETTTETIVTHRPRSEDHRRRRRKHQELVDEVTTVRTVTRSRLVPRPVAE